jgi:predicted dehydrogenase
MTKDCAKNLTTEILKVAVIGLGKMGLLHTSILNTLPNVRITALCDKNPTILKFSRKIFSKTHVVDDPEKLSDLDLDAVYVTTPIFTHFLVTKALYARGIARNIFVEKTLASSYKESKELCSLAQISGANNMVGFMKRFSVTFKKAKDLLNQEILGEVLSFDGYAYSSDFLETRKSSKASASRGGVLSDLGSHIIDLALWYFGDLEVIPDHSGSSTVEEYEDSAFFRVKKSDGLQGQFAISWCKENYRLPEWGLLIKGSKGTMRVNDYEVKMELDDGKSFSWLRQDLSDNVGFLLGDPEYFREDEYFIKSILEGCNAEPNFSTASKVDYIIDQVKHRADKNE